MPDKEPISEFVEQLPAARSVQTQTIDELPVIAVSQPHAGPDVRTRPEVEPTNEAILSSDSA
jgi:hypothetical protein